MFYQDEVSDEQLPLFVYGTLRSGQENYVLLRGHTIAEMPGHICGASLYSWHSFPLAVPGEHIVYGELMTLHPRVYYEVLVGLDQLEGYRPGDDDQGGMFRRVICQVQTATQVKVRAWMYLGKLQYLNEHQPLLITHGDWVRHRHDLIRSTRFGRFILDEQRR